MAELEEMKIYQNQTDLMYYTYMITQKYPKTAKAELVNTLMEHNTKALEYIILAQKEFNPTKKLSYLNNADTELKVVKVLVRISYRYKYITKRNYGSWSRKIANVTNLLIGWMKICLKR